MWVLVTGRTVKNLIRQTEQLRKKWTLQPLSDAVEASVQGDGLEVYVFSGRTPLEVVQRYNLYCGGGVLPPKWSLGFWHRMRTKSSTIDVLEDIQNFDQYNFPIDVPGRVRLAGFCLPLLL